MPLPPGTSPEPVEAFKAPIRAATRRKWWTILACAILTVGLVASLGSALLWRSSVRAHNKQAFLASATDVNQALEAHLRRDADFVSTLRAVLTMQPQMSATRFDQWYTQLHGKQREVSGLGTTVVEAVPAADLGAFQARRAANPAFRALVGGRIVPIAPSGRARYCLLSAGGTVTPYTKAVGQLLQGDWCNPATPIGGFQDGGILQANLLRSITDSGQFLAYPVSVQGVSTLFIEAAYYRLGAPLANVAQRRAAISGWVGSSFDISALIREAIGAHHGLNVALYHSNPGESEELIGRIGRARSAGLLVDEATLQIDGRWRAVVFGSVSGSELPANLQGLSVLVVGAIVSLLLFALVLVLTRSRERALGMVHAKTGELRHQSLHDPLTGLPNRVLALDRAEQMLARARRQQVPVAALYIDIDGFKQVNDTFGHAAGDELLQIVAKRLEQVVREGDTAARLSGDEFVVLVEGSALDGGPELVAERLLEVLGRPYDVTGHPAGQLSLAASIGIALGERTSAAELLHDADLALYEAKAAGRGCFVIFQSSMQTAAADRSALEMDLAAALAQRQLFLVYQPIIELRSERMIGVEALIRWRHPTRGVIPPLEFIPITEASGLIIPIGRWVLQEACRQAASWCDGGHRIGMSVNVSGRQLDGDGLIEDVGGALAESGLDPTTLTLEITETTLMRDVDATARRLAMLKELGVRIAVDDFGTGYSSLAYLRQFPVDLLKIDRSFISGIAGSKGSAALVHTLVQLGKTLDIETLAEGIEDRAQLETLQRERCDNGQGFLFSRPLDVDGVDELLRADQSIAHAVRAS